MKWQGRAGSGNIQDRRGMGLGLPIGGGIGGLVLLLLFSALTGTNPVDLINSTSPESGSVGTSGVPADDPQAQFVSVVLADTEQAWGEIFNQRGSAYQPPTLVLFTGSTQSACGVGQSAMGPFYCPSDRQVYLDLSFFQDLDARFGAPGDFAQAYVVAHEVGHHVCNHLASRSGSEPWKEIEADRTAGAILARSDWRNFFGNASREDYETVMRLTLSPVASATHPGIETRIAAFREGWTRGRGCN